ncbi:phosphatase PAP2 family protein [Hydrogenophaga sp.]|uniref:phosphatase PAP2 family protein n=1 Tax=Hydrogenophaga sp. TaxID=1904254 RepID=UPI003D0C504D
MDDDLTQALAWAEWLGAHALPVLVTALLAVLMACAALVVGFHRYGNHIAWSRLPRPLLLGLCLAVGAGVLVGMASLFAEMLEAFDAQEEIGQFDERLTETLARELSPTVLRFFGLWTQLGDPWPLTLLVMMVALVLLLRRYTSLALGWAVTCAGGGLLNRLLKSIFERVRPLHDHGFAQADGYSFPSGHTSGSLVVYGMLAYLCLRLLPPRWHLGGVLLAATLAFTVGWSRVILQVHWASDVIAGFAFGVAWLTLCITAIELARRHSRA